MESRWHLELGAALVLALSSSSLVRAEEAAPRVERFAFHSALLDRDTPYLVALPGSPSAATTPSASASASASASKTSSKSSRPATQLWPVVYLLHGLDGHATNWFDKTDVEQAAARLGLVVVTPEGGNGWYTDTTGPQGEAWESALLEEVVPDVEKRFPMRTDRSGKAIAGLSMGGYGAIKIGLRFPERFALAASISGAVAAPHLLERPETPSWGLLRDSIARTFGDPEIARRNDPFRLLKDASDEQVAALPFLYLDCGTEDALFAQNRELSELLLARKVRHEFRERPGRHDWKYWGEQVEDVLRLAARTLSEAR